jgi:hypothetical protein
MEDCSMMRIPIGARAESVVRAELGNDFTPEAVLERTAAEWMRMPNCGVATTYEILAWAALEVAHKASHAAPAATGTPYGCICPASANLFCVAAACPRGGRHAG